MSKQVLALALRPKTLDDMVGQKKLVQQIREHCKHGKAPNWLFSGETGSGKTTIARILAVSLQCTHNPNTVTFGTPCKVCYRNQRRFDVVEINASDITGIDVLRQAVQGANIYPRPGSKYRVYILDEAQMLSKHAQNLLLKYFEDKPRTTVWIICTTDPQKILKAVRRRTLFYQIPSQQPKGVEILVKRALKYKYSDKDYGDLSDALMENQITSAGLIMNAVEKYVAGETAENAACEVATNVNTYAICRSLVKGLWASVLKEMKDAKPEDGYVIRSSVAGYLKGMIVNEEGFTKRTQIAADAILKLASLSYLDEKMQLAATTAILHDTCRQFKSY